MLLVAAALIVIFLAIAFVSASTVSTGWFCLMLALMIISVAAPLHQAVENRGHRNAMVVIFTAFALASLAACIACAVNASVVYDSQKADAVLSCLVALINTAFGLWTVLALWLHRPLQVQVANEASPAEPKRLRSKRMRDSACCLCCSYVLLVVALTLSLLAAWHAAAKAAHPVRSTKPGKLVQAADGPTVHIFCGGSNASLPTVVYLNGMYGSSLDSMWLRRDSAIMDSDVRFCAIERPGGGWSERNTNVHYGEVASYIHDALRSEHAAGNVGDRLVIVFHSLGGYIAPALAYQLREDPDLRIVGAVAADALSPGWKSWDTPRPESECSMDASIDCRKWEGCLFWRMCKTLEPSGLLRLLLVGGVGGFDVSIRSLPPDVQDDYVANVMKPNQMDYILDEGSSLARNCGYAKRGEQYLANASSAAFEVLVVPEEDAINITRIAGATRVEVLPVPCHPSGVTGPSCHQSMILHKDYSEAARQAVARVLLATATA